MDFGLLAAYAAASLLVIISPGPDNLLVVSRGLSQGRWAAFTASMGSALAILWHTLLAVVGVSLLVQTYPPAFLGIKLIGAAYLVYLGIKAIWTRGLISFSPTGAVPMRTVLAVSTVTGMLNPKSGLFLLAFLPQFVSYSEGSAPVSLQMLLLGVLYAVLTILVFCIMGTFASQLSGWLARKPRFVLSLNIGVGMIFIAVAVSILLLGGQSVQAAL